MKELLEDYWRDKKEIGRLLGLREELRGIHMMQVEVIIGIRRALRSDASAYEQLNQNPTQSKPESAEQPSGEGLSSSALLGVCDCGGIGDECQCEDCGWKGCDIHLSRICETEYHDSAEDECPECGCASHLPKCPRCGGACDWIYEHDTEVHPPNTQLHGHA